MSDHVVLAFVFRSIVSGKPICRIVGCGVVNNVRIRVDVIINILDESKGNSNYNYHDYNFGKYATFAGQMRIPTGR
jgi:hypothetical protein